MSPNTVKNHSHIGDTASTGLLTTSMKLVVKSSASSAGEPTDGLFPSPVSAIEAADDEIAEACDADGIAEAEGVVEADGLRDGDKLEPGGSPGTVVLPGAVKPGFSGGSAWAGVAVVGAVVLGGKVVLSVVGGCVVGPAVGGVVSGGGAFRQDAPVTRNQPSQSLLLIQAVTRWRSPSIAML